MSYYVQGQSFNDSFSYHMRWDVVMTGISAYFSFILLSLALPVLAMFALDFWLARRGARKTHKTKIALPAAVWVGSLVFLPNSMTSFMAVVNASVNPPEARVDNLYHELEQANFNTRISNKTEISARAPPESKNLLLIYLESLEQSYLDQARFPDLVPNIQKELGAALRFSNLRQYPGTSYTIAGMFASQCGAPLLGFGVDENDVMHHSSYTKNIACLGDVLGKAGYYQANMLGTDARFSGLDKHYLNHGYNEVSGFYELREQAVAKYGSGYEGRWGVYDDALFEFAGQKYEELAGKNQRFNLTFETIDSHGPNGTPSPSCPRYPHSDNSILRAVHCSDYLLGQFLERIRQSPAYANTVVMVMSDHLAMRNDATHLYPPLEQRRLLAFALNAGQAGVIDMAGGHFDIAHTVLGLLKVGNDARFALGQDLLQAEQKDRYLAYNNFDRMKSFFRKYDSSEKIALCNEPGITLDNLEERSLRVGGKKIILSYAGMHNFPEGRLLIMKADKDGVVESYRMVNQEDAPELIAAAPDAIYFILTKYGQAPFGLLEGQAGNRWKWYIGNPSSTAGVSSSVASLRDISISPAQCRKIIEANQAATPEVFAARQQAQKQASPGSAADNRLARFVADIHAPKLPKRMKAGKTLVTPITVTNTGEEDWPVDHTQVRLAYHWLDTNRKEIVWDGMRSNFSEVLPPGDAQALKAKIRAPDKPGEYILQLTLIQEGVGWFDQQGFQPPEMKVTVR
jgi:phosphoglycerol transferase MdoB-like AlkP superfamily enzyme